jgi:hypothetical protein
MAVTAKNWAFLLIATFATLASVAIAMATVNFLVGDTSVPKPILLFWAADVVVAVVIAAWTYLLGRLSWSLFAGPSAAMFRLTCIALPVAVFLFMRGAFFPFMYGDKGLDEFLVWNAVLLVPVIIAGYWALRSAPIGRNGA